jgi:hypothetical protein
MIKLHYIHIWKCQMKPLTMYNLICINGRKKNIEHHRDLNKRLYFLLPWYFLSSEKRAWGMGLGITCLISIVTVY